MYERVVRFTGVDADRMDQLVASIDPSDGPPPGVRSSRLKILFDAEQGTAVAIQEFATAADMEEGGKVLAAMDASATPGTRMSVDACEVRLDLTP